VGITICGIITYKTRNKRMEEPKYKQLNILVREELVAKLKAYGAFSNLSMRTFIERILSDKIRWKR
jgi:hypothetical protein